MLQYKLKHILLACIVFFAISCERTEMQEETDSGSVTYLSVTRAHVDGEDSFNADAEDYEDRVHDLAMLAFDTETGALVASYFDVGIDFSEKSKTFTVKLSPGNRDFYFVANMPMGALQAIASKTEMDSYMEQMRNFDAALFQRATEAKGFPMSRVYLNQAIPAGGGSIYQPMPFRPDGQDKVRLIRVNAKLEITVTGSPDLVKNITYHNALSQFSVGVLSGNTPLTGGYHTSEEITGLGSGKYVYYMPEVIMESVSWQAAGSNQPINYFVIETLSGNTYNVPIVFNGELADDGYLKFALGEQVGAAPDYNIVRNHVYRYVIDLKNIEVYYMVDEWDLVEKSFFMGYGYTIDLSDNEVTITNTVLACDPHKVTLEPQNGATINGGTAPVDFTELPLDASATYPVDNSAVADGEIYLRVLYNDVEVKTYTK